MNKLNIESDDKRSHSASSDELTRDWKVLIESKLKKALVRALLQNGGEIVLMDESNKINS